MLIIEETGGRIYEDSTIFEFFFLVSKSILKRAFIKKKKKEEEEADGSAQPYFGYERKPHHKGSI